MFQQRSCIEQTSLGGNQSLKAQPTHTGIEYWLERVNYADKNDQNNDDDNDNDDISDDDDDNDGDDASPWVQTSSWWWAGTEKQLPLSW